MTELKLSIRLKTSEYGVIETETVEVILTKGVALVDCIVVYEKVGGEYLFKETLPVKHEK